MIEIDKNPYGFLNQLNVTMDAETPPKPSDIDVSDDASIDNTTSTNPINDPDNYTDLETMPNTVGLESLSPYYQCLYKDTTVGTETIPTMAPSVMYTQAKPMCNVPAIRTSDNKEFRIYFKAGQDFTDEYITRLCRFLDSRLPGQSVVFYLGCNLSTAYTMIIGAILSSVHDCPVPTKAIAAGNCGMPETMIWCFCKERVMESCGALTFGGTQFIKHAEFYKYYLEICFERAKAIGVLDDTTIANIWKTNKEYMITHDKMNHPQV